MAKKTRVAFLGSRPLGKAVLQFLLSEPDVDVIGMLVRRGGPEDYWKEDPRDLDVRRFKDEAEMLTEAFDLGISVNYWKILKEPVLSHPAFGFVNVHHSYNLRLRGRHCTTHAIIRARQDNIWHHGSTLHYMAEQLDAGQIIASCDCPILESDTALTLFQRVDEVSFEMLKEWLPRLWRERVIPYDPPSEFHVWKSSAVSEKEVNIESDALEVYDKVSAFMFPPLEPPYTYMNDRRVYLTTAKNASASPLVDAGQGRCVYRASLL